MRTSFTVSKTVPATAAVVAIPVASDGPVPKEVGLTRAQLTAMGFEGKRSEEHTAELQSH